MTKLEELAKQAGFRWEEPDADGVETWYGNNYMEPGQLQRFAALVAAAEREACAQVCVDRAKSGTNGPWFTEDMIAAARECAAAIRARGTP